MRADESAVFIEWRTHDKQFKQIRFPARPIGISQTKKGGKFGVILGKSGGPGTKTGNDFWRQLSDRIEVKAVMKINGREYARHGITVDINLIIGKKLSVPQPAADWHQTLSKIICFSAQTVEEAFTKAETFNLNANQ